MNETTPTSHKAANHRNAEQVGASRGVEKRRSRAKPLLPVVAAGTPEEVA
ncbi:hypothetical protein [Corynebacterium canis]|nr:hypothetical protein [Corynebacterium canis]